MFLVVACGVDAVGQKNHKNLAIGIDPNGCAGETGVAERVWTEEMAAASAFSGRSPAECACTARELLRRGKFGDGGTAKDALVRVDTAVEQHLAESGEVRAVLKTPAWPDTPPMEAAFSSCTSP